MALPITDTWSQSSGSTQGIATYGAYAVLEGSMSILSGTAGVAIGSGTYNTSRRTDETFNAAQYSQVVVTANQISFGLYCGPAVRCQSGANTSYHVETNGSNYYLSKCVAGSQSTLAGPVSLSFNGSGGDVLRLEVEEVTGTTTLRVYKALAASPTSFTLDNTYTDTSSPITTAGTAGVFGYGNSSTTPVIGTWTAGNITSDASAALTGTGATSALGTAGSTSSKALSGAGIFPALGTLVGTSTLPTTGETATGAVGSVTASSGNTIELSGAAASVVVGSVAASSDSFASITGVSATSASGSAAVASGAPTTGVGATSAAGTVQASAQVQTTGAKRRHLGPHPAIPVWQLGKFARRRRNNNTVPSVTAALSGVQASATVASVSVVRTLNTLAGAAATGSPGSVDAETRVREGSRRRSGGVFPGRGFYSFARYYKSRRNTEADPTSAQALSGVAGSATRGSVTPARSIVVSGVQATSAAGSISASQAGAASLTNVAASGASGTLIAAVQVDLSGVVASASEGAVSAVEGVVLAISGVQGAAQIQALMAGTARELSGTLASGTIGSMSGSTPGTWVPVNTRTSSESWNPFAG